MSEYTPDRWVLLEITHKERDPVRKVFAGWYGGFAGSDSWKLNSGVTNVRVDDKHYEFDGYSGSTYHCHANSYGMSGYMASVLAGWREKAPGTQVEIIDLETIVAV